MIENQPYSGQPCPQPGCDGVLRVETSKVRGDHRRRYLKCYKCGLAPANNIQSVPLQFAPQQSPRATAAISKGHVARRSETLVLC